MNEMNQQGAPQKQFILSDMLRMNLINYLNNSSSPSYVHQQVQEFLIMLHNLREYHAPTPVDVPPPEDLPKEPKGGKK